MSFHSWVTSSLVRHFPSTPARRAAGPRLEGARNEPLSFQVALRVEDGCARHFRIAATTPDELAVRIRRVGYVPLAHHNTLVPFDELDGVGRVPGYVPDPLFDEDTGFFPPAETHAFYLTVTPRAGVAAGEYVVDVSVIPEYGRRRRHRVRLRLHDVIIGRRRDFPVAQWFYNDALLDTYGCQGFDKRYWHVLPRYLRDLAEHGQNAVCVPVFTPSLDGVKRPSQLLHVRRCGRHRYGFDWSDVERYVKLARRCGIEHLEWTPLFTQWGAERAIRIYAGQGVDEKLLWRPSTRATSPTYRAFLAQFLPQLHAFLEQHGLLARSFFHVSDEPHGDAHRANYRRARVLLAELAPWMRCMDALSEIEFAREGLVDMPVASIRTALDFVAEGIPCWCYYCCGPRERYLNRLLDTPLAKIRMNGWLFYRWPFGGFLHWGYNYWYKSQTRQMIDPFTMQDGDHWQSGWAYGDPFLVYPGADGPIDSIRWEVFAASLRDYALLQSLGVARDDRLLRPLKSFADFPKTENWIRRARRALFARAASTGEPGGGRNDVSRHRA